MNNDDLRGYPRMIPREPLYVAHEPISWWKYVGAWVVAFLFCGVLLWSVLDDIKAAMMPAPKPEPVQDRPAQDVTGQIRTLERMIADAQQLNKDIRELDQQIRKGLK